MMGVLGLLIIGSLSYAVSGIISSPHAELPSEWKLFCTKDSQIVDWNITTVPQTELGNMIQVSCHLSSQKTLDFRDLRQWTESLNQKVAVEITCANDATLKAPWPMKAKNLMFLRILGCVIKDYFVEYFDKNLATIPDDMRVMEIKKVFISLNYSEIHEVIDRFPNITMEAYCGPVNAEKIAFNDILFDLSETFFEEFFKETGISNSALGLALRNSNATNQNLPLTNSSFPDNGLNLPDDKMDPFDDENAANEAEIAKTLETWVNTLLGIHDDTDIECLYSNLRLLDESKADYLSNYHMEQIKMDSKFPELQVYNLSGADFYMFPPQLIKWRSMIHFPKMRHLDLSRNSIKDFNVVDYGPSTSVPGIIDLRYNNISELSRTTLDKLLALRGATVRLEHNPLNCTCLSVEQFYNFLQEFPNLKRYEYLRDLVCVSPPHLKGSKIRSLSKDDICPAALDVSLIVTCSVLGFVVLLLIIFFAAVIRYRREVIILIYTRLYIKLICRKTQPLPFKEYDVFVSACDSDRQWVSQNIASFLGNHKRKSFKLFLNEDWDYGVPIADEVVRSVESSVHTLAVISKDYVNNEWKQFEFSVALRQSLEEKRRHLVVVFKEDVPRHHLPPDMRKYVSTTPSINFRSRIFQDRLFFALSCGDPSVSLHL